MKKELQSYQTIQVPVAGGDLHVGIWEPLEGEPKRDILLIHGVTASHRAFDLLAELLPDARIIAPDLRGRGRSSRVQGASNMTQHARDVAAVLDAVNANPVTVIGHSMGAFVGVVFAHLFQGRVQNLVLVDGGLPLEVPEGLDPDQIIQSVLGPTAERLAMIFDSEEAYLDFWRDHPGLGPYWSDFLEDYFRYDLEPVFAEATSEVMGYRPATKYEVARDDTVDLNSGVAINDALKELGVKTHFVTCPRGLLDQTPGLFERARVEAMLPTFGPMTYEEVPNTNHYTIVMDDTGAEALAEIIEREMHTAAINL